MRFFGVLPKLPKVELTMRTPYRTFFDNFNNFTRVYVSTSKGIIAIGNRSIPRIYLLPPGEISVKNAQHGKFNFYMHTSTSSSLYQSLI
jgi:F0F1-type ATP synthase epsilon subunit